MHRRSDRASAGPARYVVSGFSRTRARLVSGFSRTRACVSGFSRTGVWRPAPGYNHLCFQRQPGSAAVFCVGPRSRVDDRPRYTLPSTMSLIVGNRIGPYEITGSLGAGGMGEVYRARDTRLERDVALKILPRGVRQRCRRLARFQREAEVLASLNHPNIARDLRPRRVGGVGRAGDGARRRARRWPIASRAGRFRSTRRCRSPGRSPKRWRPRTSRASSIAISSRRTSRCAPDGTVKVLDFGLAKALEPAAGTSADAIAVTDDHHARDERGAGVILGTAAYMSPEQARGKTGRQAQRHLGVRRACCTRCSAGVVPSTARAWLIRSSSILQSKARLGQSAARDAPTCPSPSEEGASLPIREDAFDTSVTRFWNSRQRTEPLARKLCRQTSSVSRRERTIWAAAAVALAVVAALVTAWWRPSVAQIAPPTALPSRFCRPTDGLFRGLRLVLVCTERR